jgi:Predicted pyridoxal phosphate-dependent enzyme apparently involved in regulation of cell wall biogenesis
MITVTRPFLPPLEEFTDLLKDIWDSKWLTNNGPYHNKLEEALCKYLEVPYISLFSNGTLALVTALQALGIKGEVITTPYSFIATTHSLWWNGLKPVFVDIDPESTNIDYSKIEAAITEQTSAILPVHVYGTPCNIEEIQRIAVKHNLKVIYDAAHAFGVKKDGTSLVNYGDLSILSFHATKVYSTIEGGAIISHSAEMKHHIDNLKNFGFQDETIIEEPGINAKLNEVQAAYGLLQLKYVDRLIEQRNIIATIYRNELKSIKGIRYLDLLSGVKENYAYFPIFVDEKQYGISRDTLYYKLQNYNIYGRRYFYPLISNFEPYCNLSSAESSNLPIASRIAQEVICLPIYPDLDKDDVFKICNLIKEMQL